MPVTVRIEDKQKNQRMTPAEAPPALDDYEIPGVRSEGTKALLMWLLFMVVLSAILLPFEGTRTVGYIVVAWWFISILAYFFFAPRTVLRRLRQHGTEYEVSQRQNPQLKTMLVKASQLAGVPEPEAFLVDEPVPQIRVLGSRATPFIIVTKPALELLQPVETVVLLVRLLMHIRQGYVSRITMFQFLNDANGMARFLSWPINFYAFFVRMYWLDLAEQTADRLSLILVKNHQLLAQALLKLHVATDPMMQGTGITPQDVEQYVKQEGRIGLEGTEISTQYKLGSAIHENPYLEDRLRLMESFARSPEFKEALEKLTRK